MAAGRYSAPKAPTDLTGRKGVQLAKEEEERKAREAAELAAKDPGRKDVGLDDKGVHPETGRHGGGDDPGATEHVRVSFPIEEMTFGKEVVDPGEFDDTGLCTRLPVLGPLKMYSFEEGREYRMTPEMAGHLRQQGYLFSF
jgi:hypothetical protein